MALRDPSIVAGYCSVEIYLNFGEKSPPNLEMDFIVAFLFRPNAANSNRPPGVHKSYPVPRTEKGPSCVHDDYGNAGMQWAFYTPPFFPAWSPLFQHCCLLVSRLFKLFIHLRVYNTGATIVYCSLKFSAFSNLAQFGLRAI